MNRPQRKASRPRPNDAYMAETMARLEDLNGPESVTCRAMFGGYGIRLGTTFFGIGFRGRLFFRVNDATRPEYERLGSRPFSPNAKITMQGYYEVPAEVFDDPDELTAWARESVAVAATLAKVKKPSRSRRPASKK